MVVDLSFKEVLAVILAFFAVVAILATVIGYFIVQVRKQSGAVKDGLISDLTKLCEFNKDKIDDLTTGLEGCKAEHQKCERRINDITIFNLRLQAREVGYQNSINRLERQLGISQTDFSDVSQAPEASDFG
jgi:hypothetical protein